MANIAQNAEKGIVYNWGFSWGITIFNRAMKPVAVGIGAIYHFANLRILRNGPNI